MWSTISFIVYIPLYLTMILLLLFSLCPQDPVQFIVFVQAWSLVRVLFFHHCLGLGRGSFTHPDQKDILVCSKPDRIFYQPNFLLSHIIVLLFKINIFSGIKWSIRHNVILKMKYQYHPSLYIPPIEWVFFCTYLPLYITENCRGVDVPK